jgi:MoxR-like ATPase
MSDPSPNIDQNANEYRRRLDPFYEQVGRVIVGQRPLIDRLLIALLSGGHVLLEGVPGLAKTLLVRTAAQALNLSFARIQFTPDLLPADVIGTQVYHPTRNEFSAKLGPIFANIVLADEINRAPAKVQSALLEAMQELQVTIGESTHALPRPFQVLATQNPIEQEGTYPLPEAQLDRFLFKLRIDYPSKQEEAAIIDRMAGIDTVPAVEPVLDPTQLQELRTFLDSIYVDDKVRDYALNLVRATRAPADYGLDLAPMIQFGAGPRASIGLVRAARGLAFLAGRGYVTPQDIKQAAPDIMRHRIIISFEAEAEGLDADTVIERVLSGIAVP